MKTILIDLDEVMTQLLIQTDLNQDHIDFIQNIIENSIVKKLKESPEIEAYKAEMLTPNQEYMPDTNATLLQ